MHSYRNKRRLRKGKTQNNESNWEIMYEDRKLECVTVNGIKSMKEIFVI